jgi:hypothetical protein
MRTIGRTQHLKFKNKRSQTTMLKKIDEPVFDFLEIFQT